MCCWSIGRIKQQDKPWRSNAKKVWVCTGTGNIDGPLAVDLSMIFRDCCQPIKIWNVVILGSCVQFFYWIAPGQFDLHDKWFFVSAHFRAKDWKSPQSNCDYAFGDFALIQ